MGILKTAGKFIAAEYTENAQLIWNLIQGWKFFLENEVVVGITEETNVGRENGMTNASLLYLHENGVPSHNIPPRPVLIPAVNQDGVREQIETLMLDAAQAALADGDRKTAEANFEKAGMLGRDACKNYIADGGNLAPNAPSTIRKKMAKGKNGRGKPVPLIDTASMFNSITYAVRKKR